MPRTVFVSYARKDSDRIQQAVALLEAGGAQVFRDIDDIQFGDEWEEVITRKLQECERVMVFWSANAKESEWVGKEYSIALAQQKRMVPVLLDNTPLPPELSKYHALTNFMPKRPAWKKYGGWVVGGVAVSVLAGVMTWTNFQSSVPSEPLVAEKVDIPPLAEAAEQQTLQAPAASRPAPVSVPKPQSTPQVSVPSTYSTVTRTDPKTGKSEQVIIAQQYQNNSSSSGYQTAPPEAVVKTAPAPVLVEPATEVPATPAPAKEQQSLPLFAIGAAILALLLLLFVWFRKQSSPASLMDDEADAGKEFVDLVFEDKHSGSSVQ